MEKFTKTLLILALAALFVAALSCSKKTQKNKTTSETRWISDFETAKTVAQKEQKDLLINFTGSDWCSWCIKLKNEVFGTEPFNKEAPEHFVLVVIDLPRNKSNMSPEIIKQNEKLASEYKIAGFPTIVLANADGKEYTRTGYLKGGPKQYLKHLAELRKQKPK